MTKYLKILPPTDYSNMNLLFYFLLPLLLSLFPLPISSQENIHLSLQRREFPTDFQNSLPDLNQLSCLLDNPDSTPKKKKKSTITQLCFFHNLFYNVEVGLGLTSKSPKYEFALDLLSPYTWVKSDSCRNCYKKKGKDICKTDCNMFDFSQTHQCLSKKKCLKTNTTASLDYINHNFTGKFSFENLIIQSEDSEISLLKLKKFKLIDVELISNAPNYNSDGALGLGLEDLANSEDSDDNESTATEDSGIMTAITKAASTIDDRIFSIYIRENNPDEDAYQPTIIFGEINPEYQDDESESLDYVPVNFQSKFDWDLPIYSLIVKGKESERNEIVFDKSSAILTLDTTFIGLPAKELSQLVDYLNDLSLDCGVDKEKFDTLYCSQVNKASLKSLQISFTFKGDDEISHSLKFDPTRLLKDCKGGLELTDKSVSCYFQIHQSHSKSTILGEAFLKDFYTVFNMDTKAVGFAAGALKVDEPITHIVKREGRKFSRFLKYFFILLGVILTILCPFYIYQLCKIYKRKKGSLNYEEGNSIQIDKIGEENAYDFQIEMKEKLEAKKKEEEKQKSNNDNINSEV